jgi:hypothetical protein
VEKAGQRHSPLVEKVLMNMLLEKKSNFLPKNLLRNDLLWGILNIKG